MTLLPTALGAHPELSSHNATPSKMPNNSHQASLPAISLLTSLTSSSQRTSIQRTQLLAQLSRAQSPAIQTQTALGALKNARRVKIAVDHRHATALLMLRPLLLDYSFVTSSQRRKSTPFARTTKTRPPAMPLLTAPGAHQELLSHNATQLRTPNNFHQAFLLVINLVLSLSRFLNRETILQRIHLLARRNKIQSQSLRLNKS